MHLGKSKKAAFFDVDNTIIDLKSMFSFMEYFFENTNSKSDFESYDDFISFINKHPSRSDRKALNRVFYECFKGWKRSDVIQSANEWFDVLIETLGETLWIQPVKQKINELRQKGYLIVSVSGSSDEILAPLVRHLALDHCLATELIVKDDVYTGEIKASMIGRGKAFAIEKFCRENLVRPESSIACGDHYSDLFMLESVGDAIVVAGDPPLENEAKKKGWEILLAESYERQDALTHV